MGMSISSIVESIKQTFFYDLRSTIISICFLLAMLFMTKLLKYNGEKVTVSMKYITCVVVFFGVFLLLK